MRERLYVLLVWFVLVDASILLFYWLAYGLKGITDKLIKKLISLFVIKDNIGVEKTDKL